MLSAVIGFLILVADIWAVLNIVQTNESAGIKAVWIALVVVLPVLGLAIWYFAGPKPSGT